jgi:hypothetical protein
VQRSLAQEAAAPAPARADAPARDEAAAGRRAVGFLSVTSDVPANVFVDGRRLAQTPVVRHALKPGAHRIVVVAVRTKERRVREHTVRRGQHLEVEEHFTQQSSEK